MRFFITFLLSLALVSPVAAQVSGSAGVQGSADADASPASVKANASADLKVKAAACARTCSSKINPLEIKACLERCAAPLKIKEGAEDSTVTAREQATGKATGREAGGLAACLAACRANNQSDPEALNACLRACKNPGPAAGARLLPTVNKVFEAEREKLKEQLEARREKMKTEMETRREQMKTEIEKHREELKNKLNEFKDQRKASTTARIAEELNNLNARLTDHFTDTLDKLGSILNRVATGDVNGDGAADIAAAQTAIADARTAVTVQAGKTYTVNVTTEGKIKLDVQTARKQLHDDLKAVQDKGEAARQAVRQAATHVDTPIITSSSSVNASTTGAENVNTQ